MSEAIEELKAEIALLERELETRLFRLRWLMGTECDEEGQEAPNLSESQVRPCEGRG